MPGRTSIEAVDGFLAPLKGALACIAAAKISVSPGGRRDVGVDHSWTLNDGSGVDLVGRTPANPRVPITLRAIMGYRIVSGDEDPWRVRTTGYHYVIAAGDEEVLSYHWHPDGRSHIQGPHLHVGGAALTPGGVLTAKSHLPTETVSFESIIRLLIQDFGVEPRVEDWSERLELSEGVFRLYRNWSSR